MSSSGQDYTSTLQHLTTEDGLLHREVSSVLQDSRGFIWLSGPRGVSRFDGYQFRHWTDKDGLLEGKQEIVTEDSDGHLWLVSLHETSAGKLSFIDIITGDILTFADKFGPDIQEPLTHPKDMFITAADSTVYFTDHSRTVLLNYHPYRGLQQQKLEFEDGLELAGFSNNNTIWAHQARKETSFYRQDSKEERSVHYKDFVVEIDLNGKVLNKYTHNGYLGTDDFFIINDELWYNEELPSGVGDFYRIDEDRKRSRISLESLGIQDLLIGKEGFMDLTYLPKSKAIVGVQVSKVIAFDPRARLTFDITSEFPAVRSDPSIGYKRSCIDNSGRLWLGGDFGLYILDIQRSPFKKNIYKNLDKSENINKGLACRTITTVGDKLYVATEGNHIVGLTSEQNVFGEQSPYSNNEMLNRCWSLFETKEGDVYTGCYPYFSEIDIEEGRASIVKEEKDRNLGIWSIYEDRDGDIWMGEISGLTVMSSKNKIIRQFDQYNQFDELADATIIDITEDRNGTIWLASNAGLYILDIKDGITARYWSEGVGEYHIPTNNVHHFHHDDEGTYWLATGGDGLIKWDKSNHAIEQFTTSEGLSNDVIYAVYEDDRERLWMSSDYGIIEFDKATSVATSYLVKDGITHDEFNRVSHFQDKEGRLYFGGLNGVTSFDPDEIISSDEKADLPLRITEFVQFDGESNELEDKTTELIHSRHITIAPDDRFFQLRFALLTFTDADQIRYAYKMEGQDEDWIEQEENSIRLSRLAYGNYKLMIKGQAPNGAWSTRQLEIQLSVLRPYYLQLWFIILTTVVLIGLGYWLYIFNLKRKLELAESKRLADIDALKTKLYTNISHEFRTPLTVILGMADNIKEQPREQKLIKRNGENLLRLVNEMLDLSKLDAGGIRLDLKQADIVVYLHYLIESFYSMARERNLRLTFDSEEKEVVMDFDELKLQQIVYNLVSNAIKFTPDNGIVAIFTRIKKVNDRGVIQIRIKDSGEGIPDEKIDKIFDRFYQVGDLKSGKDRGTGVGLALTKELVSLMEGTISVESELDKGTAFTITLPIKNEAPMDPLIGVLTTDYVTSTNRPGIDIGMDHGQGQLAPAPLDLHKILIIEDNKDVASYIRSCIEEGYHVDQAIDGEEGIQKAFDIVPDVIISDVMMPKKDGYEVTQILKKDQRTSHIPIILLTAKAATDDKIEGLNVGADAYLMKPFHKPELLVRIRKLIELRTQLQSHYSNLSGQSAPTPKVMSMDEVFVQKLYRLVTGEISNADLGVDDLCREVALSQAQLYRKIKALTGKTPALYIRSIRLTRAMQLLQEGSKNVSEVAYEVGFSDPHYFSRVFVKEFRRSPKTVRGSEAHTAALTQEGRDLQ